MTVTKNNNFDNDPYSLAHGFQTLGAGDSKPRFSEISSPLEA